MTAPTWQELAALGITEALDGGDVEIDGEAWDTDTQDAEGDVLPPGQLYLTHDDGRTVLVRVDVTVLEGTLT